MVQRERAAIGFGEELDDFDPTAWSDPATKKKPPADIVKRAGEAAGFRSRETKASETSSRQQQRRRRTGRNAQFNIKARPETIEAFTRIADTNGWGLGETFEKATELLGKAYK
jgi:hypothetical protein